MFISDLSTSGAMPTLEAMMSFAAQRQRVIANNIANVSTPDFRPQDVSTADFQASLADAIDRRREAMGGSRGELRIRESNEIRFDDAGRLRIQPREHGQNVLFHDRNTRDLEGLMQDLVENASVFRMATELLRSEFELQRVAISERV